MKYTYFFVGFLFLVDTMVGKNSDQEQSVYILIHGTWPKQCTNSPKQSWYRPEGDFFTTLETEVKKRNGKVHSFLWSGKNDDISRKKDGLVLAKLIESYPLTTLIYIITHSHGTNLGFHSSQELGKDKNNYHRIKQFFALGSPISDDYQPNMDVIEVLYNFYSYNDLIQRVLGTFEREITPPHDRIANIRVTIDGEDPDHFNLHHTVIAQHLCNIDQIVHQQAELFTLKDPLLLHFFTDRDPLCVLDTERELLRILDEKYNYFIMNMFRIGMTKLPKGIKNIKLPGIFGTRSRNK